MKQTEYLQLRDIVVGDFMIKDAHLFYKGKLVATTGKIVLASEEEAFFLFIIEDEETTKEFKQVFLLNSRRPCFYTSNEYQLDQERFQFLSPFSGKNAFRRISFLGSRFQTKIVGDYYHDKGHNIPFWKVL